jgi:arylsulfatase A-like enzyme
MNERDLDDKPWWVRHKPYRSTSRIESTRVPMLRSLVPVDDQIDRLLSELEDLGELDDTLVVFTSDNGFLWGEHHLMGKRAPYMPSVNVPFLVRWPGQVAAGRSDGSLVGLLDLAPTILTAAQAPFPHEMDGIDILDDARRRLPLEFWGSEERLPTWRGVVARSWVYVEYLRDDGRIREREYYDLRKDPHQLSNVYRDGNPNNDPSVTRLEKLVQRLSTCVGHDCVV